MGRSSVLVLAVCLLLAGLLSACSFQPVKTPRVTTYTLGYIPKVGVYKRTTTALSLLVSEPMASAGYQTHNMVYMEVPYQLKSYSNTRWVSPPAQMLLPLIVSRIQNMGFFSAVVSPPFSGMTNLRLDTKLLIFRQEFFRPDSQIRLVLQTSLIDSRTHQILASRRFQSVVNAPENNPYGGVLAANTAVGRLASNIANFAMRTVVRHKRMLKKSK